MRVLNTFGSVLSFAIELETGLQNAYQAMGDQTKARAAQKRRQRLERARAEHVLEITLEPIHDLDAADYSILMDNTATLSEKETVAATFYQDAAPKINVRQAQRILLRCAREHSTLASASESQTTR